MEEQERTARLLGLLGSGDERAGEELFAILYRDLRAVAGKLMADERREHTLQPTALVHEAWVRLCGGAPLAFEDKGHFLRVAARAMRRVLVDHARGRGRKKRAAPAAAGEEPAFVPADPAELLALDEALDKLGGHDAQLLRVVELRYFAGLSIDETAAVLGITPRQVRSGWTFARGWLREEMGKGGA